MDDRANDGEKNAGQDGHKTLNWHHVWKSVEDAGSQAGKAIKKQVEQVDTKELGDKAKHAADVGLKVVRGKSNDKQANQISDAAAKYIPGAGLLRTGAELAHETGADGKVLEGKKGPLHAPSEKTMKNVGKEAIGTMIPIPFGGKIANEVINHSGVKDKIVDGAIDAAKHQGDAAKHQSEAAKNQAKAAEGKAPELQHKVESKGKTSEAPYPPKVILEDTKHGEVINAAKEKVGKLFHSLHKTEAKEDKRN
jgi:hypothetical protein